MSPAPPAEAFPAYPASWYLFCESAKLRRGPVSRQLLGRRLVAFRTASGRAAVMDARCAHLGADLGFGTVAGETIQCPFHGWRYGCDGVCASVPSLPQPPPFARLETYPVVERHGYLFFFNRRDGREPFFPLPFFLGEDPDGFVAAPLFRYVADCTWYMNSAHAFDLQHFASVHERELLAPPAIDCPAPFARRNSYLARVVGDSLLDRLLRLAGARTVETTLTIWGGTFAVITADFGRLKSGFLMAMEPLEDGRTLCQGIVCAPRQRSLLRPLVPLQLRGRRFFTHGYLKEEARRLRGTRYVPAHLGPNDQDMIDFFHWLAALPQESDHESIDRRSASAVLRRPTRPAPIGTGAGGAAGAGIG